MRAVVQRVKQAAVHIGDTEHARIRMGLLVLLGVEVGDTPADAEWICGKIARLRIFVNLGRSERIWAISHHLRHVAHDCFDDAGLARFAGQPYEFNRAVSAFAFGDSRAAAAAPQPRHLLYFEPGEVWCLNSMVTAHQVLYGTRAAVATMPFAYDDYECPAEALPHIVAGLCHAHAT